MSKQLFFFLCKKLTNFIENLTLPVIYTFRTDSSPIFFYLSFNLVNKRRQPRGLTLAKWSVLFFPAVLRGRCVVAVVVAARCGDEIRITIIKLLGKFTARLMPRDMRVKLLAWSRFIACGVLCGVIRLPVCSVLTCVLRK